MNIRTDLALEGVSSAKVHEGISQTRRGKAFRITEICIKEDKYGEPIGKRKGRYITLEGEALSRYSDNYKEMTLEFANELKDFIPEGQILVVGLGNKDITPDALGPQVSSQILATRHLREELSDEDEFLTGLRQVSVMASGVLGQTGIETAEIVHALSEKITPKAIIVIDALACSDIKRLGTTIQLSDAGISPGSGVQNKRKELSYQTLGIPVIAIGVPTVVDMHTIVQGLTGYAVNEKMPNMMVTPRDVDKLIERAARLIACGINLALHPQMTFEDVESLA
ncbi:MAG: GPR endopeptidase [Clostridiales bacterium]|jgi:spore protease|nr:GPR endopeptidase [Clostridiales bacterium]